MVYYMYYENSMSGTSVGMKKQKKSLVRSVFAWFAWVYDVAG